LLPQKCQNTGNALQWKSNSEAAVSAIVEQQKDMEAVDAENAANNAKLLENIAHVSGSHSLPVFAAIRYQFARRTRAHTHAHIFPVARLSNGKAVNVSCLS
jgi:hypothetical protein